MKHLNTVFTNLPLHNPQHIFNNIGFLSNAVIMFGIQIILLHISVNQAKMIRQGRFYIAFYHQNILQENTSQIIIKLI